MKATVFTASLAAAVALTFAAADARSPDNRPAQQKQQQQRAMPAERPQPQQRVVRPDPNAVYDEDGTVLARDPDPFIRLMIMRDPRPWEHAI